MSQLAVFNFTTKAVRVFLDDAGAPWFVAVDVCKALTLGNSREPLSKLDDDERGVATTDTLGGHQEMATINESGLYSLILGCRKPAAKQFKKWVTAEVLPALRKTGTYTMPGRALPGYRGTISNGQRAQLESVLQPICNTWALRGPHSIKWAMNHLAIAYGVSHYSQLPADQFESAMAMLKEKAKACYQFLLAVDGARDDFERLVLGGGEPWSSAKHRELRAAGKNVLH